MDTPASAREELLARLVARAFAAAGDAALPANRQRIDHGSANVVVLGADVAVRIGRSDALADESLRAQRLVDALPPLPFSVPASLCPPVRMDGMTAVVQRRVHGEAHASGSGDPAAIATLLDALRAVPVDGLRPDLAEPHGVMGGARWFEVMTTSAIPLLDEDVRAEARRRAEALAELGPPAATGLVHGDLAGGNVLWSGGVVAGVLDWDLATWGDPATDVAALGGWHGWDAVSAAVDAETVRRARVVAATHPLQVVCFTLLRDGSGADLARAAARASARLRIPPGGTSSGTRSRVPASKRSSP
jgi:aminoglycoside phosphotransferase (APT) family kinase protein